MKLRIYASGLDTGTLTAELSVKDAERLLQLKPNTYKRLEILLKGHLNLGVDKKVYNYILSKDFNEDDVLSFKDEAEKQKLKLNKKFIDDYIANSKSAE